MADEQKIEAAKDSTESKEKQTQAVEQKTDTASNKKDETKKEVKLSKKSEEIIKNVESMTVLELADLVKALEEKFGVSAQVPVVQAAGTPGGTAQAGGAEEEKSSYTVVLANSGDKKIQVIKEIRAITTLGLKEAKDLVESAPKTIKEGVSKEEAEKIKKQLEQVGAKVELK